MKYLIRHGQTDHNVRGIYQSTSDCQPLTPTGEKQILSIGRQLESKRMTSILSSPSFRARQSASLLCHRLSLDAEICDWLAEVSNPKWSGLSKKLIQSKFSSDWKAWRDHPDTVYWGNLNRVLDDKARDVVFGMNRLRASSEDILVSHDHTLRSIMIQQCGLNISSHKKFSIPQGSLSLLDYTNGQPSKIRAMGLCFDDEGPCRVSCNKSARIILVRHGATDGNASRIYQGLSSDLGLSHDGLQQMAFSAELLSKIEPTFIFTSELRRTQESAEILGFSKHPIQDSRLNEFDYGHWVGKTESEVMSQFPNEYRKFYDGSHSQPIHGAESFEGFRKRIRDALFDIIKKLMSSNDIAGRTAIIVTHDVAARIAICELLNINPSTFVRFPICNGGISVIELSPGGYWRLVLHNALNTNIADRYDHAYF